MSQTKQISRRSFLKKSGSAMLGTGVLAGSQGFAHSKTAEPVKKEDSKIREYRTLGRTGFKVSDIGIGASFLTNQQVLELAIEKGMNYIDTAEHYSNGESERNIGRVLAHVDRKKMFITTKLNLSWGDAGKKGIKERFMKCLERMKTDYADCLMIHMCMLEQVKHENFHAVARELKAEGKLRFTGVSSHGQEQRIYGNTKDPMEKVIMAAARDGRFDVALFVYNFLQKEQGEKIIEACAKSKMGVTLMKTNPVNVYKRRKAAMDKRTAQGKPPSEALKRKMADYRAYLEKAEDFKKKFGLKSEADIRDAAIKFVLSHPGVHTVCPSFHNFDDVEIFAALSGRKLLSREKAMLQKYESEAGCLYCRHACGECEPSCPHGVPVNTIMRFNHYFEAQGREKHAMSLYNRLDGNKADCCTDCSGHCQDACPHRVPIQHLLLEAHDNLVLG